MLSVSVALSCQIWLDDDSISVTDYFYLVVGFINFEVIRSSSEGFDCALFQA